jgi:hypothetical protein
VPTGPQPFCNLPRRALGSSNDHEEIAMNRIHPIRRLAGILAGLAGALLAFTAASPAAFAVHVPPPGGAGTVQAPPQVHSIVTSGMPGWQITLIAAAAALLASALTVIAYRIRAARRRVTATTASAMTAPSITPS